MDRANQVEASKFAIPDSIIVGTAGAEGERSACASPGIAYATGSFPPSERDWVIARASGSLPRV